MDLEGDDGFSNWFDELVELAKSEDTLKVSTAYKGNWVDYYSSGKTPHEALQASQV